MTQKLTEKFRKTLAHLWAGVQACFLSANVQKYRDSHMRFFFIEELSKVDQKYIVVEGSQREPRFGILVNMMEKNQNKNQGVQATAWKTI